MPDSQILIDQARGPQCIPTWREREKFVCIAAAHRGYIICPAGRPLARDVWEMLARERDHRTIRTGLLYAREAPRAFGGSSLENYKGKTLGLALFVADVKGGSLQEVETFWICVCIGERFFFLQRAGIFFFSPAGPAPRCCVLLWEK